MIEVDANQVIARLCDQISAQARQIAVLQAQIQTMQQQQGLDPYTVINNLAEQIKSQAIQIAVLQAQIQTMQQSGGDSDE